jgi:hypothetical protein
MSLYCLCTSKKFCKALDGTRNAKNIAQINEGISKICLFQVTRVMGMMWLADMISLNSRT